MTHLDSLQTQNAGEEEENAEEPALENSGRINQLLYIKATSSNKLNKVDSIFCYCLFLLHLLLVEGKFGSFQDVPIATSGLSRP